MILVTGATGTTGTATLNSLIARGASVRAFTRRPDAVLPGGVERAVGSFDDPASLAPAMNGIDSAFLVTLPDPAMLAQEAAFLRAATDAGVQHIVRLSVLDADSVPHPHLVAAEHAPAERALVDSGISWTILRANGFTQNLLAQAPAVAAQDIYVSPLGAAVSMVDTDDIGAMAAAALTEPGHRGRIYEMTGPQALTGKEIAAIFSEVLGREITHVQPSPREAAGALIAAGLPPLRVEQLASLWAYFEHGGGAAVSDDIPRVLGRPALSVRDFIERHRHAFAR